jgi:hypothetical protein
MDEELRIELGLDFLQADALPMIYAAPKSITAIGN